MQNENFSHTCQSISNELLFDRMILKTFNINTSNYWKLSKIWVMSKLKNPTLNSISVWVHHSRIITLSWVEKRDQLPQHLSCLACLGKWWTCSVHLLRAQQQIRPCLTQVQLEKTFCYKQSNWAQFCQKDKIC